MNDLSAEQLKTLKSIYELICHLMHLDEQFSEQFCLSVYIIASDLLRHILADGEFEKFFEISKNNFKNIRSFSVVYDAQGMQLISIIVSILCYVLRETPENADIVEKILFAPNVNLVDLLKNGNAVLK